MSTQQVPSFTIQELFSSADQYVIPRYQRNYAWGKGELDQLIQDIYDYANDDEKKNTPYYIGTLVVCERNVNENTYYETIDGQQRLTSLHLVLCAIRRWCYRVLTDDFNVQLQLRFISRPKSENTLQAIQKQLDKPIHFNNDVEYETGIKSRYLNTEKKLKELFKTPQNALSFYAYLKHKVTLIRVTVPKETDMNDYFEIMNNRGEQLEKHEVLKSRLIALVKDDDRARFAVQKAWNAVENMERYVQYGFTTKERKKLFGKHDWNTLQVHNFVTYADCLDQNATNSEEALDITTIIGLKGNFNETNKENEATPNRFNSVINFQGFLLHVLRIFKQADIPLDDKQLIPQFEKYITTKEEAEAFAFALLKCKHLFDQYVIKREFLADKDHWSLQQLKLDEKCNFNYASTFGEDAEQDNVKMLLAMFHVSLPSMNYKHWLSAALNYLYAQTQPIDANNYAQYLFTIAKSYFYDRILAPEKPLDYFDMIFKNAYANRQINTEALNWNQLHQGTSLENFAFNFTDYLLWKREKSTYYDMSARSSVEHFYPQHPMNGEKIEDSRILNSFGNLCLVSSSTNSRLSNYDPIAKKNHYKSIKNESLKLQKMMDLTDEKKPWNAAAIQKYEEELLILLKENHH